MTSLLVTWDLLGTLADPSRHFAKETLPPSYQERVKPILLLLACGFPID